jgi:hypothetical protein
MRAVSTYQGAQSTAARAAEAHSAGCASRAQRRVRTTASGTATARTKAFPFVRIAAAEATAPRIASEVRPVSRNRPNARMAHKQSKARGISAITIPLAFCASGRATSIAATTAATSPPTSSRRARKRVVARAAVRAAIKKSTEARDGENGRVQAASKR